MENMNKNKFKIKTVIYSSIIVLLLLICSTFIYINNTSLLTSVTTSTTKVNRSDLQNMVVETAKKLYYNRKYSDYEQHGLDAAEKITVGSKSTSQSTFYWRDLTVTPESAGRSNYYAIDCSGFVFLTYYNTIGYDMSEYYSHWGANYYVDKDDVKLYNADDKLDYHKNAYKYYGKGPNTKFMAYVASISPNPEFIYYKNGNVTKTEAENNILSKLQIGDVIVFRRSTNTGHTLIYVGNKVTSTDQKYVGDTVLTSNYGFLHATGTDFPNAADTAIKYTTWEKQVLGYLTAPEINQIAIIRPINKYCKTSGTDCVNVPLDTYAKARNDLKSVSIEQWVSESSPLSKVMTKYSSLNVGNKVFYYVRFTNNSTSKVTIKTISATVPTNSTFSSASSNPTGYNYSKSGDTISWSSVSIPAGSTYTFYYSVFAKSAGTLKHNGFVVTTNNGNKVQLAPLTVKVEQTLNSSTDISAFTNAVNNKKVNTSLSQLDAIKQLYKTAIGVDLSYITSANIKSAVFKSFSTSFYVKRTDTLSGNVKKVGDILVPGLYGGKKVKGSVGGDRAHYINAYSLEFGDIIVTFEGTNVSAFMFYGFNSSGVPQFIKYSNSAFSTSTGSTIFREIFGKELFVVLRPSKTLTGKVSTVTLNRQNGSNGTTSVNAVAGSPMPTITIPSRDGYAFGGYYTATNGGGTQYYTAKGASARNWYNLSPMTLYAKWTIATYTVKYNANGGTGTMANSTHTYNTAKALTANAFKRTGYTFLGWSTSSTATTATYTDKQSVKNLTTKDSVTINLYAVWKANSYTVKYNANGGTGTMANSSYTYGTSKALTANAFTRTGYTFLGWSTSSTATAATYTDKQSVKNLTSTAGGTVNLYAVWKLNTYTVKYNANGGTGTMANSTHSYGTAKTLTANAFKRTGYTFLGWSTSSTATAATYTDKQSVKNLSTKDGVTINLYAVWKVNTYTVKYNANGGTGTMSNTTHTYDVAKTLTANAFTRSGYTFLGWSTSSTATTATYTDKQSVKNLTSTAGGTVNLYAVWKLNTYTVKYNANGGTGTMANSTHSYGTAKALTANAFKRTGYTFLGWSTSSTATAATYTDKQSVKNLSTKDGVTINLYAVWKVNTYTVKYNANGGAGTMANSSYTYDIAKALTANAFTRTGYTFLGWSTSSTATAATYTDKQSVKNLTSTAGGTVNLYAVWKLNTYTIKYNANGGTGTMANSTHSYGTAKALTANTFTRSGYTFLGWSTSSTSTTITYTDKQSVKNLSTKDGVIINLYAVWKVNTYTVKYNANGGTGTMANSYHTYDIEKTLNVNLFTRSGYIFLGWSTSSTDTAAKYANKAVVKNLTTTSNGTVNLYAIWTSEKNDVYTVRHWQQNCNGIDTKHDDKNYTLKDTFIMAKNANTTITIPTMKYTGFTSPKEENIKNNNITIDYYYVRNTYNLNLKKGTGIDSVASKGINKYGCQVTIQAKVSLGYTFDNWSGNKSLTSNPYKIIITDGNNEYTAKAKPNTYTIKYNANGGTGTMANSTHTFGTAKALTSNTFKRSGYKFLGWSTSNKDKTIKYKDNQSVKNMTYENGKVINLYAIWQKTGTNQKEDNNKDNDKEQNEGENENIPEEKNETEKENNIPYKIMVFGIILILVIIIIYTRFKKTKKNYY